MGRLTGQSAIGAFKQFGRKYAFIGVLASAVPFIITPYYCIIGGWVTKYAVAYLVDGPAALADGGGFFTGFITSDVESFLWMLVFMAVAFAVVALGVKGGIEKANLFMMPALIVMAVGIAVYTLTMPGALDGALYYLVPDFSKFSPELVVGALGQMFYSLSLAMGIMITYGSYLDRKSSLTQSVVRVGGFDRGRVVSGRPHDRAGGVRGHGVGRGGGGQFRPLAHVRDAACRVRRHGRRGRRDRLLVLLAGAVRRADERHLAHRDVRVHRAGRRRLVAQEVVCRGDCRGGRGGRRA